MAVAASWNLGQSENEIKLSDLALDNIEALAYIKSGDCRLCTCCWSCTPSGDSYGCSPCYS
ncbi:NVEALA domain-containing protein [Parabacteroides sp.]